MRHFEELLTLCVYILDLQIIVFVLLAVLFLAIGNGVFSSQVMSRPWALSALVVNGNPVYNAFLIFWSYIILLSPAMPIALYISLVLSTCCIPLLLHALVFACILSYHVSSMPLPPQAWGDPYHPQPVYWLGYRDVLAADRQTSPGQEYLTEWGARPSGIPAEWQNWNTNTEPSALQTVLYSWGGLW